MLESTITSKGQTTLPRDVRRALGLAPGDKVRYLVVGDDVRIVRSRKVMTLAGELSRDGAPVTLDEMARAIAEGASGIRRE